MSQALSGQGGQKPTGTADAGGAADPSMEDILASIRRILSDDEQSAATPAEVPPIVMPDDSPADEVLRLSETMLVVPPDRPAEPQALEPVHEPIVEPRAVAAPLAEPAPMPPSDTVVAPETAVAAASSVSSMLRTLVQEREHLSVYRGGPTIEDLVREEIRSLLKQWLDENLPPMVERLVRVELERVLGRVVP